jgi:hypothetical protein
MSYTPEQLAELRKMIATGARRTRVNGEEVEFRSLEELERLESKIQGATGVSRVTHVNPIFDRGF